MCTISRMKEIGNNSNVLSNDSHICLPGSSATISRGLKDCFQLESSSYLTANKVNSVVKAWINDASFRASSNSLERQRLVAERGKCVLGLASPKGNVKILSHNTGHGGMIPELNTGNTNTLICNNTPPCQEEEENAICGRVEQLVCSRDPETSLMNVDMALENKEKAATPKDATSTEQAISVTLNKGDDVGNRIEQKPCRKDEASFCEAED
ncbi:hypothetical protein Tco_1409747 [Tanacetum coccineum]